MLGATEIGSAVAWHRYDGVVEHGDQKYEVSFLWFGNRPPQPRLKPFTVTKPVGLGRWLGRKPKAREHVALMLRVGDPEMMIMDLTLRVMTCPTQPRRRRK